MRRITRIQQQCFIGLIFVIVFLCFQFRVLFRYHDDDETTSWIHNRLITNSNTTTTRQKEQKLLKHEKYILLYNSYWGQSNFQITNPTLTCPITGRHCHILERENKSHTTVHAIVMHGHQFRLDGPIHDDLVQHYRHLDHQPYFVFFNLEPPSSTTTTTTTAVYNDFWNWTMTYRTDSDIVRPYGYFEKVQRDEATTNQSLSYLARRPKLVAWMVSHCSTRSRREDYVRELQKYIPLDIFGTCGAVSCNATHRQQYAQNTNNCSSLLERDYKFYLSFEQVWANDYVTEKFFLQALQHKLVPIVLGPHQNYQTRMPTRSYIHVLDYQSPQTLASYLQYLDQHDEEYLSYLEWHRHYTVVTNTTRLQHEAFTKLCTKLHTSTTTTKTYSKFQEWWWNITTTENKEFSAYLDQLPNTTTSMTMANTQASQVQSSILHQQHVRRIPFSTN
mmetsp:Transcript_27355/g.41394  ORF Transcript_27355/g.41394 Transcript_27355/m.41394 type:complete len:446 (+) Transcript_27355:104-1441(+)